MVNKWLRRPHLPVIILSFVALVALACGSSSPTAIPTEASTSPTAAPTQASTASTSSAGAVPGASGTVSSRIVFHSVNDGKSDIYVMNGDGSNLTSVTDDTSMNGWPVGSPDGSKIAFESDRDGDFEIFVMDVDGSNPIQLTDIGLEDHAPHWSPDGNRIAFHSTRDEGWDIMGNPDGNVEIYTTNPDGSETSRLMNNPGIDTFPSWSPDGSKIAFISNRDQEREIYVMGFDGSNPTRLTEMPKLPAIYGDTGFRPKWSPDGSKIAFVSEKDGNSEIYAMDVDGSNWTRLTDNTATDQHPSWSLDGSKIVFASDRDGDFEIYVMDADGSNPKRLTTNAGDDMAPDWFPDGAS